MEEYMVRIGNILYGQKYFKNRLKLRNMKFRLQLLHIQISTLRYSLFILQLQVADNLQFAKTHTPQSNDFKKKKKNSNSSIFTSRVNIKQTPRSSLFLLQFHLVRYIRVKD